jgi:hypothetical protein
MAFTSGTLASSRRRRIAFVIRATPAEIDR